MSSDSPTVVLPVPVIRYFVISTFVPFGTPGSSAALPRRGLRVLDVQHDAVGLAFAQGVFGRLPHVDTAQT